MEFFFLIRPKVRKERMVDIIEMVSKFICESMCCDGKQN